MGRIALIAGVVLLTIYAVVEVAQSSPYAVRVAPRWLWAFAVILLPVVGPLLWLLFGRPGPGSKPQRPIAPDDDPDFLAGL